MTKLKCELLALTKRLRGGLGVVNLLDLVWIIRPISVECNQSWNAMVLVHVKKKGSIVKAEPRWSAIVKFV